MLALMPAHAGGNMKGKCKKTCEQFNFVVKNLPTEKFSTPPTDQRLKTQPGHTGQSNDYVRTDTPRRGFFPLEIFITFYSEGNWHCQAVNHITTYWRGEKIAAISIYQNHTSLLVIIQKITLKSKMFPKKHALNLVLLIFTSKP